MHIESIFLLRIFNLTIAFRNVSATQAVPRFIQEITDVYTKEGNVALFECIYSGNPKPGNCYTSMQM